MSALYQLINNVEVTGVEGGVVVMAGVMEGVEVVAGIHPQMQSIDKKQKTFQVHDLSEIDHNIPKTHDFNPLRAIGAHFPLGISELSPADLFKLFFDMDIVQKVCEATNEYAELQKKNVQQCINTLNRWSQMISMRLWEYLFLHVLVNYIHLHFS